MTKKSASKITLWIILILLIAKVVSRLFSEIAFWENIPMPDPTDYVNRNQDVYKEWADKSEEAWKERNIRLANYYKEIARKTNGLK